MRLIFAIPGNLDALTGGYKYDRNILARLPSFGIETIYCPLSSNFPHPTREDCRDAIRAIRALLSPGAAVLMDGLAFGVMPPDEVGALDAPVIALCHHPLGFEAGLTIKQSQALIEREKQALAIATHVIVTSARTADTLKREFCVDGDRISVALPGTEPAPRAVGSGGVCTILAIGSITPRKAFHILIEALAALKELEWRLNIVGGKQHSPETVAALELLIKAHQLEERVALRGELVGDALERIFSRSDIFVSSSLYEGYGMALAEAMARGLPIIAATGGAAAETIPEGAGLKVTPGSVAALREALQLLILNEPLRRHLGDAAWAAGQLLPRWDTTAAIIAEAVMNAANRRQPEGVALRFECHHDAEPTR